MTNTQMINISGCKTVSNGSMEQENKWQFSLKSMVLTKLWWFLQQNKSKKLLLWIFRSILHRCWRKGMLCLTSMIKLRNSKAFKWKEEVSWESQKFSRNKSFLNILKVKLYKNAMLIVLKLQRSILPLLENKVKLWILIKF